MYIAFLLLTIVSVVPYFFIKNTSKVGFYIAFVYLFFLSLVFGLRYDVGIDYNNYEYYFDNFHDSFRSEFGYSLVNYVVYSLGLPFYVVTLFMSFLTNYLVFFGVRSVGLRGIYFHLAIMIYASNFMLLSLNGMRQALAASVIFFFISSFYNNSFYKFIKGCLIASMFHVSAIGFLLLFFVKDFFAKKVVVLTLFLIMLSTFSMVFFLDFSSLFMKIAAYIPYYDNYEEFLVSKLSSGVGFGVLLRFLFSTVLVFIFLIYSDRYNDFQRMIASLFVIGLIFNFLSVSNFMWGRIGLYFYIFEVLFIPYLIMGVKNRKYRAVLFLAAFVYVLIFVVALNNASEESKLIYKSVFD